LTASSDGCDLLLSAVLVGASPEAALLLSTASLAAVAEGCAFALPSAFLAEAEASTCVEPGASALARLIEQKIASGSAKR